MYSSINLKLNVPDRIKISGTVQCYKRKLSEYQITHKNPWTKRNFPGPHYEINVSSILNQIIPEEQAKSFFERRTKDLEVERTRRSELVKEHCIWVGNDLLPYVSCRILHEDQLYSLTRGWLAHQTLFTKTGININDLACFVHSREPTFEDWLINDKWMNEYVSIERKDIILHEKNFFMIAKKLYQQKKHDGQKRWYFDYLIDIIIDMFNATVSVELV